MQPLVVVGGSSMGGVREMKTGSSHYRLAGGDVVSCSTCI